MAPGLPFAAEVRPHLDRGGLPLATEVRPHLDRGGDLRQDVLAAGDLLVAVAERLGVQGLGLNAIRVLAQRHRLSVLPEIARFLVRLADENRGVVRATVTSAKPLAAQYLAELEKALTEMTKRRVVIDHKEDPSLLAGVVTQIGDNTIDGSIKGRLADVERQLLHA